MGVKKQLFELDMEQQSGLTLERSVTRLHVVTLFINLYAENIMLKVRLMNYKLESILLGEISTSLDVQNMKRS